MEFINTHLHVKHPDRGFKYNFSNGEIIRPINTPSFFTEYTCDEDNVNNLSLNELSIGGKRRKTRRRKTRRRKTRRRKTRSG